MGPYKGDFTTSNTVYVIFDSFSSDDPSASITLTGLAVTDIEIYKNGSTTQRASDAGYTLLDTDGIDFDTITGIHGFSIDLSDNTDAGFYTSGGEFDVIVSSVTIDGATINFHACSFSIGRTPNVVLDEPISGHITAGTVGKYIFDTFNDTDELQIDWNENGRLDVILDELTTQGDTNEAVLNNLNLGTIYGSVVTGTLSTTQATSDLTGYADDQLIGRVIIWTSGAAEGEGTDITDYASASGLLTFTALTTAPANGDTFKIV